MYERALSVLVLLYIRREWSHTGSAIITYVRHTSVLPADNDLRISIAQPNGVHVLAIK